MASAVRAHTLPESLMSSTLSRPYFSPYMVRSRSQISGSAVILGSL